MVDLTARIGALTLKNPVMPASGAFSEDLAKVFDLDLLGAVVTKTVTPGARAGNPTPRVCETQGGMLNSIGIPSNGVGYFVEQIVPLYRDCAAPLVASVSADTADGFARMVAAVSVPGVAAIEANISCPNIEAEGRAFAMRPGTTLQAMRAMRAATDLPLWAKLTPNTGETPEVARAAQEGGADALVVANTILAMAIDVETRRPKLGALMGGLSGPALKPVTLRMAYQAARAVSIPVIGCGGIRTVEDVVEYLLAGCSAVQVGTETFVSPSAMPRLIEGLRDWMAARGVAAVSELVGAVRDGEAAEAGWAAIEAAP